MPKNRGWFRVYDRAFRNPKLITLDDPTLNFLLHLWGLASEADDNGNTGHTAETFVRIYTRWPVRMCKKMILTLVRTELVDLDNDCKIVVRNWNKHQYIPDSKSPEYQKAYMRQYRRETANHCKNDVKDKNSYCKKDVRNQSSLDKNRYTPTPTPPPKGKGNVVGPSTEQQQPKKAFSDKLSARLEKLKVKTDLHAWREEDIWDVISQAETKNGTGALPYEQMAGYIVNRLQELGDHNIAEEAITAKVQVLRNSEASARGYWPPAGLTARQAAIEELQGQRQPAKVEEKAKPIQAKDPKDCTKNGKTLTEWVKAERPENCPQKTSCQKPLCPNSCKEKILQNSS